MDYHRLSAPGIMSLAAFVPPAGSQATPQDGVFAVMLRDGRSSPRIFALRGRETLLGQMQQAARKKLAVSIIGELSCLAAPLKCPVWADSSCFCKIAVVVFMQHNSYTTVNRRVSTSTSALTVRLCPVSVWVCS